MGCLFSFLLDVFANVFAPLYRADTRREARRFLAAASVLLAIVALTAWLFFALR